MKKCPMCAEEIDDEAQLCTFCGAKLNVTKEGYCTNCHQVRELDENSSCIRCGSSLVDIHIKSERISAEATPSIKATPGSKSPSVTHPATQAPGKKSLWKWILIPSMVLIYVCPLRRWCSPT